MITETSKQQLVNITSILIETEPNSIALSQKYFAASVNNIVWYY